MIKKIFASVVVLLVLFAITSCKSDGSNNTDFAKIVDPFIGTNYVGNTYPGAQYPFGMVQLSPDNGLPGWDRIAGYFYQDSTIAGFSHTHLQGTGAGDLYDISFMPTSGSIVYSDYPLGIYSRFKHADEKASAGYYSVLLEDYNIDVELTATKRTGIQRYTFHNTSDTARIILNLAKSMNWDKTLETHIELITPQLVVGYRYSTGWAKDQKVFFATKFSSPIDTMDLNFKSKYGIYDLLDGDVVSFQYNKVPTQLMLQTALSSVSIQSAITTLEHESISDFESAYMSTKSAWNKELSKIVVNTASDSLATIFYTALYHSFTCPTLLSDVDGNYMGADRKIHSTREEFDEKTAIYGTFSLWDTYRAAHPLYTLLQPEKVGDFVKSLLVQSREIGRLPVWNFYGNETDMMIGYHSVPVIVDAYMKGLVDQSLGEELLRACVNTANTHGYRGLDFYRKYNYVAADKEMESVSKTLEYAFDDACIYQLSNTLLQKATVDSLKEFYASISQTFFKRSLSYEFLWNETTSFFQPKLSSGEWKDKFNPQDYSVDVTESNAWQYVWSVQHDIEGLINLMGGKEQMAEKLDDFFSIQTHKSIELPLFSTGMIGQYAHGNEPSHHVLFMYNTVDQPWKIVPLQDTIMNLFYDASPSGLCGNEDCGQMSAWYVWTAIGLYPMNPISGSYEIVKPSFSNITIQVSNTTKLEIKVDHLDKDHPFINKVLWNGKELNESSLSHSELIKGGCLQFEMTNKSGICWWKN